MRASTLRTLSALILTAALSLTAGAQTVDATQYGVAADPAADHLPALRRAMDAAAYQRRPGQVAVVQLPCGTIGYAGQASIPDSVLVLGCGGGRVTQARDDNGVAYTYVRPVVLDGLPETRLRVLDSSMLDDRGLPVVTRFGVRPGTTWMGVAHLVLDGNWEENLADYEAIPADHVKPFLQDGNGVAAFALDGSAGRPECRGEHDPHGPGGRVVLHLRGVIVTGYAANGLVGTTCMWYDGEAVSLGRALHNHTFYGGNGRFRDLTLEGWAWTNMVVMADLEVDGLTILVREPSPSGRWNPEVVNVRQGTLTVRRLYADTRNADGGTDRFGMPGQLFRTDYGRVLLDGLDWATGPGSGDGVSIGTLGDGGVVRRATLHGDAGTLFGGLYHSAPPRDGVAHLYADSVVVTGRTTQGLVADRGEYPARLRLSRVDARGMFVMGGSGDQRAAVALTDSRIETDRVGAWPHTGGEATVYEGRYVTPATLCADRATRTASNVRFTATPAPGCQQLLAAPIPEVPRMAPVEPPPPVEPPSGPPDGSPRYILRSIDHCWDTQTGRFAARELCPPSSD